MSFRKSFPLFLALLAAICLGSFPLFGQETTGGLQGTITDPSGAVISGADVTVTSPALIGEKSLKTGAGGYYRFANLPPGNYTIAASAKGFRKVKRENVTIEVGHLPTLNIALAVGDTTEVVEVSAEAPLVDATTTTNQTNLTNNDLNAVPHGLSYQSVIQYAPMARDEPLAGGSAGLTGNSGGSLPGSSGNGLAVGFQIGGAADSENSYLVEGQDTENISGGASQANVPFEFVQEVQVKTSGIEAEHGGALGGVVNVVMRKGSNAWHGSLFTTYQGDFLSGAPSGVSGTGASGLRYDPTGTGFVAGVSDPNAQTYQPKKDSFHHIQPGFTVGGPIMKDRLWFFLGFAPLYDSLLRKVNFAPATLAGNSSLGVQDFTRDQQTYFTTFRLDATLTQKIRVFGSWLNQYQRASGVSLPARDPIAPESGFLNLGINTPQTQYSHGLGYSNPNTTYNVGGDITITPHIVSTTRYGYFFNNYHDFGWPTQGVDLSFNNSGQGALDNKGNPLPAGLALPAGASTAPFDSNFTEVNASKHYQFDQDFAFFKGGWWGTHNIKVGYQFNRLSNVIDQHGNLPFVFVNPGAGASYRPSTTFGAANCALLTAEFGSCAGQFGFVEAQDFATVLKTPSGKVVPAVDNNHALYAQDSWTIGHGLTLDLGLRVEKEDLPAPPGIGISTIRTIHFNWTDKVEPRLGAAWGSSNGKIKVFGSYGVINDVMKLLLAQTSFGAQGFETCAYPLGPDSSGTFTQSDLNFIFGQPGRTCPTGVSNVGALFAGGVTPPSLIDAKTGVGLIENLNFRPEEPIVPGLKPYRQHEAVGGVDYQLFKNVSVEARYDRRRLDHVIEDASLADPNAFEIYNVVNPGEGVNKTINGYASFLTSLGDAYGPGTAAFNPTGAFGTCPSCPNNPKAVRSYDGVELRLTKGLSSNWGGMFSYTYSRLRGNYAGLTTTDQTDGGITGRNSPDTTRSFDEPFYYFGANGLSNNGPLPTDRPHAFKGYGYYTLPWWSKTNQTTFGIFQAAYSGSPVSASTDVGLAVPGSVFPFPIESLYPFGRGKFVNITGTPGNLTFGTPFDRRTHWYTQTDFNVSHAIKVNKHNEAQTLTFSAEFTNLLNQRAVTAYWEGFNSNANASALFPFGIFNGASFYQQVESGYNLQAQANAAGLVVNSLYGKPLLWQSPRNIRLGVTFTF